MRRSDRLIVSARHIRGRLVESILVVLATGVGVALVASMAAFIRSYNRQTDYLLSHPAYRELVVEAVGNETELDEPAVAYDPQTVSEVSLGFDDIQVALDNTTLVKYGYLADRAELSTQTTFRRGPGGGPPGGAPPEGFAPPGDGGAPPEGFTPPGDAASVDNGLQAADSNATDNGGPGGFDLEQFFQTDDDVVTELPLESFPGREVTSQFFGAYGLTVSEGSAITAEDVESGNQVIVLGNSLARILFPDGDAIGTPVRLNFQTYTVVGILSPTPLVDTDTGGSYNDTAFVTHRSAQTNFGGNDIRRRFGTRTLRFAVADSANLDAAAAELKTHFDTEFGDGAVRITAPLEELKSEREKLGRILAVVLFLATAGLFIASINLFNLMLMRVIKRTKAIGITRALGATRRDIARQFVNESALMSLAGAIIGLAVSPLVYDLLRASLIEEAADISVISWPFLVLGAAGAFIFTLLFGFVPARQASRIDAALAIRSE